jgi:hypothetical protein
LGEKKSLITYVNVIELANESKYLDRFLGILEEAFLREFMNVDRDNSVFETFLQMISIFRICLSQTEKKQEWYDCKN